MKKLVYLMVFVLLFGFSVIPSFANAFNFTDNFDDGNADGWWLGYSLHTPWVYGNWRVEDGTLVQDIGADGVIALVENHETGSMTISTDFKGNGVSGYGGLVVWYKDLDNLVLVRIYPSIKRISIEEAINGSEFSYNYEEPSLMESHWYNLKTEADSETGELKVFLDGAYLFSYTVTTPNRTAQSGVFTGNSGGFIDNFSLSYFSRKSECKDGGWMTFTNPSFKNQGECVRYVKNKP